MSKYKNNLKEYNKLLWITIVLLIGISAFVVIKYNSLKVYALKERKSNLKDVLWQFDNQGISYKARYNNSEINIDTEKKSDIIFVVKTIENIANKTGWQIEKYNMKNSDAELKLSLLVTDKKGIITRINIVKKRKVVETFPKIAIIIDDAGYGGKLTDEFIKFPGKITIAVLPAISKSRSIAKRIFDSDKEVMLHMPMEPENYEKREIHLMKYEIMSSMSENEVYSTMDKMLSTVPYTAGINNHQGSKVTSDRRIMKFVLQKVKDENLFFIDSRTSPRSVTKELAQFLRVPYAVRNIFLDNREDYNYIKKQMDKLISIALKRGKAIGIGHISKKNTLKVLYDALPELRRKGIKLVFASEIVKKFNNMEVN